MVQSGQTLPFSFCHRVACGVAGILVFLATPLAAAQSVPTLTAASWIWTREINSDSTCNLRKVFSLGALPSNASVLITADNGYELYVNGSLVGSEIGAAAEVWQTVERFDITSRLAKGRNVIGIRGTDLGGVRGVIAAIRVDTKGEPPLDLVTDNTWRAIAQANPVDYSHPEYVEGPDWSDALAVGPMGIAPWGTVAWSENGKRPRAAAPRTDVVKPAEGFLWPERVAFLGDDCSVYVPVRGDAWGVCFRVGDWSRAYTEFDLPCPSKIGRKLYSYRPGHPDEPKILHDAGSGVIGSPSVSFDGTFLLVAMARPDEKFFHIYRIPADGGEPTRLTQGPFHDIDPIELPDGRIVFTSTRIGTFEEYHQPPSRALFRMNSDGSEIHPITSTLIFDNEPKVTADGRIIFIRTDNFFDRGKVETQLHSIRPDGTDGFAEFAANVGADYGVRLRAFGFGSPAPMPEGGVAYISSRGNFIGQMGSAYVEQRRLPDNLGDLAALPDGRLLCTVLRRSSNGMVSDVLGVVAPDGREIASIFQSPSGSIHSPVYLGARKRPPVIPDYVDRSGLDRAGATGFLYCQDARLTTKGKADWQRVKAIRVLGAAPLTVRSSHSHIVHVGHETIELGTVPLAQDGSFSIEVPADTPIALQAVDAEGRSELNEMSWIYVRPGERRSCVGCHQPREVAPPFAGRPADALRAPPVKLLGQGDAHRFRGNNPGVTGMMDLQFERFRECASLNRNSLRSSPTASRREEVEALLQQIKGGDDNLKISAAQRLALLREHAASAALTEALHANNREVRLSAALALAACGNRESIAALAMVLNDQDPVVVRAATIALENLTGSVSKGETEAWRTSIDRRNWDEIEGKLIGELGGDSATRRAAIVALGHIGGAVARVALREFVRREAARNPYPPFVNDNRTDNFTFPADSPLNPRTLQEAVRALGQLRDVDALPLLREVVRNNIDARAGNLFIAEAAIEALGRIGSSEAEAVLIETFGVLKDYWEYVGWYSDHPALYACHSSPLHARLIAALDAIGSTRAGPIVPHLIRSVPTDPDRALFPQNDDYELLVGRLIRRSGRGDDVIRTCLALLGDPVARPDGEIESAILKTHPAWGGHPGPENRAAQILSLTCRDKKHLEQVQAAFARFVGKSEEPVSRTLGNPTWTPVRHWTLFYLARTLGNLGDASSVKILESVLADRLNEARHGRPDPAQPEIHFLQLEYTPCWRAAVAWALGEIGDRHSRAALLGAARNLDNAIDVRHACARALKKMALPEDLSELEELGRNYPEVSVRKILMLSSGTQPSTH